MEVGTLKRYVSQATKVFGHGVTVIMASWDVEGAMGARNLLRYIHYRRSGCVKWSADLNSLSLLLGAERCTHGKDERKMQGGGVNVWVCVYWYSYDELIKHSKRMR